MKKIEISKKEYTKLFYQTLIEEEEYNIYLNTKTSKLSLQRFRDLELFDLMLLELVDVNQEYDSLKDVEESFNQEYFWDFEDELNEYGHYIFKFID